MRRIRKLVSARRSAVATVSIVMVGLAGLAGCSGGHGPDASRVHIVVAPQRSLYYDPVSVSAKGLAAGSAVTVQATARDGAGKEWTSSARFTATAAGTVSLGQPSVGGSYTGVNAMGLFEFMTPAAGNTETSFAGSHTGYTVDLTAVVNGKSVVSASVVRQGSASVGVTEKDYRPAAGGLYGDMFLPKASTTGTTRLHPAVLAFGGSDGGLDSDNVSAQLAAHGYPTLDLAYFAEPGLPAHLANIPLEYFVKALALLRSEPGVDPKHVLVMGVSRGGEAALLLGATYPTLIDGVVAGVPSAYVYPEPYSTLGTPAWTVHGKPVPYLSQAQLAAMSSGLAVHAPTAEIAVERIRGPILLTCGGDDQVWPSCTYTTEIVARLKAHHFAYPVTSLRYPNAGHFGGEFNGYYPITVPYLTSTVGFIGYVGGTVNATESAWGNNTQHLLALLAAQP